jgi:hypothetical protein
VPIDPPRPSLSSAPQRVGTDGAGFEIAVDRIASIVVARMWGLWSSPVWEKYEAALLLELGSFWTGHGALLVDASACPPQGPDAQKAILAAWQATMRHRLRQRVITVDNPLTRLQVRRLLTEGGLTGFVLAKSDAEARAILKESK